MPQEPLAPPTTCQSQSLTKLLPVWTHSKTHTVREHTQTHKNTHTGSRHTCMHIDQNKHYAVGPTCTHVETKTTNHTDRHALMHNNTCIQTHTHTLIRPHCSIPMLVTSVWQPGPVISPTPRINPLMQLQDGVWETFLRHNNLLPILWSWTKLTHCSPSSGLTLTTSPALGQPIIDFRPIVWVLLKRVMGKHRKMKAEERKKNPQRTILLVPGKWFKQACGNLSSKACEGTRGKLTRDEFAIFLTHPETFLFPS